MFAITGFLGAGLALAPFLLGFADHSGALWANLLLGSLVAVVSMIGLASTTLDKRWEHWVLAVAGVAAFIAPFAFGYADHAQPLWAGLIVGAGLVVLDGFKVFQLPATMEPHR